VDLETSFEVGKRGFLHQGGCAGDTFTFAVLGGVVVKDITSKEFCDAAEGVVVGGVEADLLETHGIVLGDEGFKDGDDEFEVGACCVFKASRGVCAGLE
jgi:hypothetical protein